jgi:hypothetical protein
MHAKEHFWIRGSLRANFYIHRFGPNSRNSGDGNRSSSRDDATAGGNNNHNDCAAPGHSSAKTGPSPDGRDGRRR